MLMLAMDRSQSVRRIDVDGRLHVEISPISKANVCPYFGREIPNSAELELEPDRIYYLLRDPAELEAAASTFNNLPVLSEHVPVTAYGEETHRDDLVVGSTGTDAAFDGEYLTNSLVVWAKASIDGIVKDEKRELSSAYRYVADMTPGNFGGIAFDGVMRNIVGNHVALVIEGRAGPDVVIGDEKPMKLRSIRAVLLSGGLTTLIRPLLAADAALDLTPALAGVSDKSLKKRGATNALASVVYGLAQPHLAADAALSLDDVRNAIQSVAGLVIGQDDDIPEAGGKKLDVAEDEDDEDEDDEDDDKKMAGDEDDDEKKDVAEDEDDDMAACDEDDEEDKKPAMDAAAIRRQARADARRDFAAIRKAEKDVAPIVGELAAMDSASDYYAAGLKALGVNVSRLPKSAYAETFRAVAGARDDRAEVAQDAAPTAGARKSFNERYAKRTTLIRG